MDNKSTMAEPKPITEPTFSELVTGIVHDVGELFKQQTALIQWEMREDYRKTKEAVFALGLGVGTMILGGLLLVQMVVHLLAWAVPALAMWGAYAIVGGLLLASGAVLYYLGQERFKAFNPLPDKSVEVMKENMQWLANRK